MALTRIGRWAVCLGLMVVVVSGCTAIQAYPSREVPAPEEINSDILFVPQDVLLDYDSAPEEKRYLVRNRFITRRLAEIDKQYAAFLSDLQTESNLARLGVDVAVLGLGTAGALLPAGTVTRVLAGVSAALTGARASYEKNILLDQTVLALIGQMEASRAFVRAEILERISLEDQGFTYTMPFVQADLQRYYYAGTLPGALLSINESIGVEAREADAKLNSIPKVEITQATLDIELILKGGDVNGSYLPGRVRLLEKCARENNVTKLIGVYNPQSIALFEFMALPDFASDRTRLAACLQMKIDEGA